MREVAGEEARDAVEGEGEDADVYGEEVDDAGDDVYEDGEDEGDENGDEVMCHSGGTADPASRRSAIELGCPLGEPLARPASRENINVERRAYGIEEDIPRWTRARPEVV